MASTPDSELRDLERLLAKHAYSWLHSADWVGLGGAVKYVADRVCGEGRGLFNIRSMGSDHIYQQVDPARRAIAARVSGLGAVLRLQGSGTYYDSSASQAAWDLLSDGSPAFVAYAGTFGAPIGSDYVWTTTTDDTQGAVSYRSGIYAISSSVSSPPAYVTPAAITQGLPTYVEYQIGAGQVTGRVVGYDVATHALVSPSQAKIPLRVGARNGAFGMQGCNLDLADLIVLNHADLTIINYLRRYMDVAYSLVSETHLWWGDSEFGSTPMASAFRDYRNGMGNRCLVANAAFPGTTSVDWLPSSNPASHYQQALAQFRGVLANYTIPKSIMFSVGTNDAHLSGAPTSWASNVAATLAAFQSDLGITLPIVYTVIPVTAPDVQAPWPNWDSTRANQLTATGVGAPVQTPVGTYSDRMHFDAAACAGIVPNLSAALG